MTDEQIAILRARAALETLEYDTDEQRLGALWHIVQPFQGRYRAGIDVEGQPFVETLRDSCVGRRMITVHELKTHAWMFDAVALGKKTAELRFDDRNYEVGDFLVLKRHPVLLRGGEIDLPDEAVARISHIVRAAKSEDAEQSYGLRRGYVMLSFKLVSRTFMESVLVSTPS